MNNRKAITGTLCGACTLTSGIALGQDSEPESNTQARITSLAESIEPLRAHFNAKAHGRRFVALLSSTCPACVFGAEAIRDSVLDAYPEANLSVTIVWVDMLRADDEAAAMKSAEIFDDRRVRQFHDPTRRSSTVFAKDVLYADGGPAWDIYLYYEPDATWDDALPKPVEWYHQLSGGKRADPALFRRGQELVDQLRESTGTFIEQWPRAGEPLLPAEDLQLLTFDACPNSATMRLSLADALDRLGESREWKAVDLEALPAGHPLLRYGSPTLLVRGRDILGESPQPEAELTCRLYADGIPTSEIIEARLREIIESANTDAQDEPRKHPNR